MCMSAGPAANVWPEAWLRVGLIRSPAARGVYVEDIEDGGLDTVLSCIPYHERTVLRNGLLRPVACSAAPTKRLK